MLDVAKAMVSKSTLSLRLSKTLRWGRMCSIGSMALMLFMSSVGLPIGFDASITVLAQEQDDQAILDDEELFTKYVRAALDIERQRRSMMGQVKEFTGGSVPSNVCANLKALPESQQPLIQGICTSFAKFASATVTRKYKLLPKQFNAFQRRVGTPAMQKRINQKIQELKLNKQ